MFNFKDKIVLAIGGAGYLCSPVCVGLASHGASVVVTDLYEDKASELAQQWEAEYCCPTLGLSCDVGNEHSIREAIQSTTKKFGHIDILINAAFKGSHGSALDEMPHDAFDEAAHVQLTGTFLLAREAAQVMPDGGNMVFFSSMYGRVAPDPSIYHAPMLPNPIDYGVVKAGLEQMIRYLAVQYASRNIRVNGVAPGAFPHAAVLGSDLPDFRDFQERLAQKSPLKRIGRQDELAGPVAFLASDEASFVTGHILVVDGGWTIW